jgi:hypothetical protein
MGAVEGRPQIINHPLQRGARPGDGRAPLKRQPVPDAERSVVINRPLETVFAFFAGAEDDRQWRPAVRRSRASATSAWAPFTAGGCPGRGRPVPADTEVTRSRVVQCGPTILDRHTPGLRAQLQPLST